MYFFIISRDLLNELYILIFRSINNDKIENDWNKCERILPESFTQSNKYINYEIGFTMSLNLICNQNILQLFLSMLPPLEESFHFVIPPEITLSILQIISTLSLEANYRRYLFKNMVLLLTVSNCVNIKECYYDEYYNKNLDRNDINKIIRLTPTEITQEILLAAYQTLASCTKTDDGIQLIDNKIYNIADNLLYAVKIKYRELIVAILSFMYNYIYIDKIYVY